MSAERPILKFRHSFEKRVEAFRDRPENVELCVLIDRRFSRQFPIQPDYTGRAIDSIISQKVKVFWKEKDGKDEVALLE